MRICIVLFLLSSCAAFAQSANPAANPQVSSAKGFYVYMKTNVLKAAESVPADKYDYRPVEGVRTIGQLFAHIADAQFGLCGTAAGQAQSRDFEKALKTKASIIKALNDSFAACDANWLSFTDASSAEIVQFHGPVTRLSVMSFNTAHGLEHYGNLVTYMRMLKLVPPTAEPAAAH